MLDIFKTVKNAGVEMGLKMLLNGNKKVKTVAEEVLEIKINPENVEDGSKNGEAKLRILLKGEPGPLSVSLSYKLRGDILSVTNVKTSKKWLDGLAEVFKDQYARIDLNKHKGAADMARRFL